MTMMMTVPQPARHRLGAAHVDALAAGDGDPEAVSELLTAERSWRLVQLRAVLDAVHDQPEAAGPLPKVGEAWELLVAAERQAPSEVASLLLHPQAGTWAGYVVRRLRGSTRAEAPLWVDVGYLHALAAAAAIRAGLDFAIGIPVRDGFACLPALGGAFLPGTGSFGQAEVRGRERQVTIAAGGRVIPVPAEGAAPDGWTALPAIRAEAAGEILSVRLDHLDPYRNLRTVTAPDRLAPEQVQRWRELLQQAWQLVVQACPRAAAAIARGLFSVVPQPAAERFRTMSASAGDAFGSMIVSEPEDAPELAVTLVHEFQHIKLGGLLHLTPLHHIEPEQRLYAPWRDDPRPLGGLLQGVYAFVGITEFWRAYRGLACGRSATLAQFEFARWRGQVAQTLDRLQSLPELTEAGQHLLAGLAATAATWPDEPVPAPVRQVVEAAAADHRTRWRLHHLRPDPATVTGLAQAWQVGMERPDVGYPAPEVVADTAARRLDTRAVLQLWRLTDPDGFAQLHQNRSAVDSHISGTTPADLACVAGQVDRARELYLAELAADPASPGGWAGLGLVEAAQAPDGAAAGALRDRPELVRAVHSESREAGASPGDPLALAAWIGGDPPR